MKPEPEIIRSGKRGTLLMAALSVAMGTAAVLCLRSDQSWWVSGGFITIAVIAVLGTFETLRERIEIHESHLRIVKLLGSKEIRRDDFLKYSAAKGCHAVIQAKEGKKYELPDVSISPHALGNKIRAWAKRTTPPNPSK